MRGLTPSERLILIAQLESRPLDLDYSLQSAIQQLAKDGRITATFAIIRGREGYLTDITHLGRLALRLDLPRSEKTH